VISPFAGSKTFTARADLFFGFDQKPSTGPVQVNRFCGAFSSIFNMRKNTLHAVSHFFRALAIPGEGERWAFKDSAEQSIVWPHPIAFHERKQDGSVLGIPGFPRLCPRRQSFQIHQLAASGRGPLPGNPSTPERMVSKPMKIAAHVLLVALVCAADLCLILIVLKS
jgi:hypothetical protein